MPTSKTESKSADVESGGSESTETIEAEDSAETSETSSSKVRVEATPQVDEEQYTSNQLTDLEGIDLPSELDDLQQDPSALDNAEDGGTQPPFTKGVSIINPNLTSSVVSADTKFTTTQAKVSTPQTTQNVVLTNIGGSEPVVLTDAQLKNLQSLSKRTLTNSSNSGVVTKVIITKNPTTNQPQAMPSGSGTGQQTIVFSSANTTQTISLPMTPTKTLVAGSLLSPTKLVTGSPLTPQKQSLLTGNKIMFSPGKSPSKYTMIPVGKSPQKIAPAPGQVITMVSKSVLSGAQAATTTSSKPATVTLSPSKLIIQKPGGKQQIITQQITPKSLGTIVSNMQQVPVAGSKFQYVRLVATSTTPNASQGRPLAPATATTAGQSQMKITVPVAGQSLISKGQVVGSNQRLLLPAAPVSTPITIRPALTPLRPALGTTTSITQLPPGTTIISSGQNMTGVQRFAIVPTQYVTQLQQTIAPTAATSTTTRDRSYVPIASSGASEPSSSKHNVNGSTLSGSSNQRPRKPCNCTKSQCLKLYCDCFANGEFCHNCNCNNCFNNLEHEEERGRAIKACLDRNPQAFHPKIGKGKQGAGNRRHNKGCNCKRSGCLKNYCECYEAKILCTALCKCCGCKNFEESPDRKTLMHLADAAEVRVQQQTAAKSKLSSQISNLPSRVPAAEGERLPYTFVTKEVAEATCSCLLAQAEECERTQQLEVDEERMILEEFGRCLLQVIESANKTKDEPMH